MTGHRMQRGRARRILDLYPGVLESEKALSVLGENTPQLRTAVAVDVFIEIAYRP
jgi:hypothetical protein